MKCMVCKGEMIKYFTKHFEIFDLDDVDYWKCPNCGFVAAKTLFDLSEKEWGILNEKFHSSYHFTDECTYDANWTDRLKIQAETLSVLKKSGLLRYEMAWLDYGCGDGKLSQFAKDFGIKLLNYDEFAGEHTTNILKKNELKKEGFDLVISTSVFEHVRDLKYLEAMENLVSSRGCFAIHTLVREEIPKDPDWFYLLPVHCALFSNKSMHLLFDRWGYKFSIYHVPSRLWFWYKFIPKDAETIIESLNENKSQDEYFIKNGFMDYWK